jgi:hypothetical protein
VDVLPREGETKETYVARKAKIVWLDEIFKHGENRLTNKDPNYKCPSRRTMGVVYALPHAINDPQDPDHNRVVTNQPLYPTYESPVTCWSSRHMSRVYYALGLDMWLNTYSFLTIQSRRGPPNFVQILSYPELTDTDMGKHRDAFTKAGLERMMNGKRPDIDFTIQGAQILKCLGAMS